LYINRPEPKRYSNQPIQKTKIPPNQKSLTRRFGKTVPIGVSSWNHVFWRSV
jgi:hypothetical protein